MLFASLFDRGIFMKKAASVFAIAMSTLLITQPAMSSDKPHWGYSGHAGPDHWGALATEFSTCSSGKNQSPINLTQMVEGELPQLAFNYQMGGTSILNNGHAIQVNYKPGSSFSVNGQTFELKQFHLHSPSENTIDGKSFPMEAHFVHADKQGDLAVIALMYQVGEFNAELEKAWKQMPMSSSEQHTLDTMVDANKLLPKTKAYYRFNGSLTTPPCTEGVNWFVMKAYSEASQAQIDAFIAAMGHHANNRPVQPVNARLVVR
jgi:carbonic anhydrase